MPNNIRYTSHRREVNNAMNEAIERALEAIGLYVEGEAKLRCPVDTGNLRNSYDHKVNMSNKSVTIGTNVSYSIFVEKGTRNQRAQPHLTPAAEENISTIQQIASQYLSEIGD